MQNKKRVIGIIGIIMAVIVLIVIHSFTGNPVSNALAKKAAKQHIDTNYSELNLQILKSSYNFKFSEYSAYAHSLTSEDTTFRIYVDSFGNVVRDDYEHEVANNFTTFRRLDKELREAAQEMIATKLDYDFYYIALSFVDDIDLMKLERDMKLDVHSPPLPLAISTTIFSDDVSYNKIAEVTKALEAVLKEQVISVSEYNVRILPMSSKPKEENKAVSWKGAISVSNFPSERVNDENLPQVIEEFESKRAAEENTK